MVTTEMFTLSSQRHADRPGNGPRADSTRISREFNAPALRAVVHAAGVVDDGLLTALARRSPIHFH